MNQTIKKILFTFLVLVVLFCVAGCSEKKDPYQINDEEKFNVSIKYDANGGFFTTNTSVIVDSYNLTDQKINSSGMAEIALLSPDDPARGNDAFTAVKNGYFLAGWYSERTETADSQGEAAYSYSGKWDFQKDLVILDPNKTYSAAEPVMTLYAAWVPLFAIEFYDLDSGDLVDTFTFNPMSQNDILVPAWDTDTGAIEMYDFPQKKGYTFQNAYYDPEGTRPVDSAAVDHPGLVDDSTGTAKDPVMKLYVDWMEGEWYHIYSAQQFLDHASVNGSYIIHEDLDFTDKIWPSSLMYGNYSGTILGNGHIFRNIETAQTNNSKVNAGLFGNLTETAAISDLTFENATLTIKAGTRVVGANFGLLAGTISSDAQLNNVQITGGKLQIDSGCYFGVDDYAIGLVCGMGSAGMDDSGITCEAVGEHPENVLISVEEGRVSLEFVS